MGPEECEKCGADMSQVMIKLYIEPAPEYDRPQKEEEIIQEKPKPEILEEPAPIDDTKEAYCFRCNAVYLSNVHRCPTCGRPTMLRVKASKHEDKNGKIPTHYHVSGNGFEFDLFPTEEKKAFGRNQEEFAKLNLPKNVSRIHFEYYQKDGVLHLIDHSKNGTFIDNIRLNPENDYAVKDLEKGFCQLSLGTLLKFTLKACY